MEKQIRIFQTFFPEMLEAREKAHVCVSEPEGLIKDNDSRIMSSWELGGVRSFKEHLTLQICLRYSVFLYLYKRRS